MSDVAAKSAAPGSDDLMREQRLQRNLKVLVAVLGLLILAGLVAVIGRVIYLSTQQASAPLATTAVATPAGQVALEIPRGARIVSIAVSGDRLAIHHDGPSGVGIAVVDLATGRRLLDVRPIEATPRD